MRVMGLDIGEKRIGVAVANTTTGIASPLRVMDAREVLDNARTWRMLVDDNEPELLVCGLPKTMRGSVGQQAARIRERAERIAQTCGLPVEFVDERLSSAEAKRLLREQGLSEREMRGKIDSVAASLFLETWLAANDGHKMEEQ
ncbi:MAG: Holliday junction resolvase RuvX [Coriobacteriales bacterium]